MDCLRHVPRMEIRFGTSLRVPLSMYGARRMFINMGYVSFFILTFLKRKFFSLFFYGDFTHWCDFEMVHPGGVKTGEEEEN